MKRNHVVAGLLALTGVAGMQGCFSPNGNIDPVRTDAFLSVLDSTARVEAAMTRSTGRTYKPYGTDRNRKPDGNQLASYPINYVLTYEPYDEKVNDGVLNVHEDRLYFSGHDGTWLNIPKSSIKRLWFNESFLNNQIRMLVRGDSDWGIPDTEYAIDMPSSVSERKAAAALNRWLGN
jgi:hypothetical protein